MPPIDCIRCSACDFERLVVRGSMAVAIDPDTYVFLPHPGEAMNAWEITGQFFPQLVSDGRIVFLGAYLCLNCGEIHQRHRGGTRDVHIQRAPDAPKYTTADLDPRQASMIYLQATSGFEQAIEQAIEFSKGLSEPDFPCGACGSEAVYRVTQLGAVLQGKSVDGMPSPPIECPMCHQGAISIRPTGVIT